MKNKIKFLRRSEGIDLTQGELAKALGISRQHLNAIENGKTNTSIETALKIADFFNKDLREIFFTVDVVHSEQNSA